MKMPIYNETFAEAWDKREKINDAIKLLTENGYEVIDKSKRLQPWQEEILANEGLTDKDNIFN